MNKLFSKIAALTLGLGLAVGVGVAAGRGVQKTEAVDSDFSFSGGSYNSTEKSITWTSDYLTVKQVKGTGTVDPNSSYISAPRWYQNNVVTFTPAAGIKITELAITTNGTTYTTTSTWSAGTASISGAVINWEGEQLAAFTFTPDKQIRVTSMAVTYESTATITGIELSDNGVKKAYYVGDEPSLEGIVATATYEGGQKADITKSCTITASPAELTLETTKVTYSATYSKNAEIIIQDLDVAVTVTEAPKDFTRAYTFTDKDLNYSETYDGEEWSASTAAYGFDDSATKRGAQFTASSTVSLDYSSIPTLAIKSVSRVVVVASSNNDENTVEVLAGDVNKVNEGKTKVTLEKDSKNVEIEFTGTNKGKIEVKLFRQDKSTWIKSITVDFVEITDEVQLFINAYMHMDDYKESKGLCLGDNGYYAKAKAAYGNLTSDQKVAFVTDSKYSAASARLAAWAEANQDTLSLETGIITTVSPIGQTIAAQPGPVILIVMGTIAALSFGIVALLKTRKKEK